MFDIVALLGGRYSWKPLFYAANRNISAMVMGNMHRHGQPSTALAGNKVVKMDFEKIAGPSKSCHNPDNCYYRDCIYNANPAY